MPGCFDLPAQEPDRRLHTTQKTGVKENQVTGAFKAGA